MNSLLLQYFHRLKTFAKSGQIDFHIYNRDTKSNMPFSVHLRFVDIDNIQRDSWGSGATKDEAFGKALMEMIERIYFCGLSPFSYKKVFGLFSDKKDIFEISDLFKLPVLKLHPANTNGVAIHTSKKRSIQAALCELIERHVVLYSLVAQIGPHFKIQKEIAPNKTCSFYIWKGPLSSYVVVGAFTDQVGTYFSSGCAFKKDEALEKAELELNSFLYLDCEIPADVKIVKNDIQSINRYHKYSGDFRAIDFFEKTSSKRLPDLRKDRFYFTRIPLPSLFNGLPSLYAARVIHPDVQQLFFDNWHADYLNTRIFPADQELPPFPHIIA